MEVFKRYLIKEEEVKTEVENIRGNSVTEIEEQAITKECFESFLIKEEEIKTEVDEFGENMMEQMDIIESDKQNVLNFASTDLVLIPYIEQFNNSKDLDPLFNFLETSDQVTSDAVSIKEIAARDTPKGAKRMAKQLDSEFPKRKVQISDGKTCENSIKRFPNSNGYKRRIPCKECPGCLRLDCGNCNNCLDKKKFGGPGKLKQRCKKRTCASKYVEISQNEDKIIQMTILTKMQNVTKHCITYQSALQDHDYLESGLHDGYLLCVSKYCTFKTKFMKDLQKHSSVCRRTFMTNDCHTIESTSTTNDCHTIESTLTTNVCQTIERTLTTNESTLTTNNCLTNSNVDFSPSSKLWKCFDFKCAKLFPSKTCLKLHIEKYHVPDETGYNECDECGAKVVDIKKHKEMLHPSLIAIIKHNAQMVDIKKHKEMLHPSLIAIIKHNAQNIKEKEVEKLWKCFECAKLFPSKTYLKLHIEKYHNPDETGYNECGAKVVDIKKHKEMLHKGKRFKRLARKRFIYQCCYCTGHFRSQEDLNCHKEEHHKGFPPCREVHVHHEGKGVKCPQNARYVAKKMANSISNKSVSEKESEEGDDTFVGELKDKMYTCNDCEMETPSKMSYIQHILRGCNDQFKKVYRKTRY